VIQPLKATAKENGKVGLSGSFGVFYSGHLVARVYDEHGHAAATPSIAEVNPVDLVSLETEIASPGKSGRVSIHLIDENGVDRGTLQEVRVSAQDVH
jgi:hypothetical protein